MAKHPVPKCKTAYSKTRIRYNAFVERTQKKLMSMVDKMKSLAKKGHLDKGKENKEKLVKKIKA